MVQMVFNVYCGTTAEQAEGLVKVCPASLSLLIHVLVCVSVGCVCVCVCRL